MDIAVIIVSAASVAVIYHSRFAVIVSNVPDSIVFFFVMQANDLYYIGSIQILKQFTLLVLPSINLSNIKNITKM